MKKTNFNLNNALVFSFFVLVIIYFSLKSQSDSSDKKVKSPSIQSEQPSVDTYIPKGYVLVPVELKNKEAVESLIGNRGIVDLYVEKSDSTRHLIASKIKMLRAPLNPNVYAVLVREDLSYDIIKNAQDLWAIVQNKYSPSHSDDVVKKYKNIKFQNIKKEAIEIEYFNNEAI